MQEILAVTGWFFVGTVVGAIAVFNILWREAESGLISFGREVYETNLISGGEDGFNSAG